MAGAIRPDIADALVVAHESCVRHLLKVADEAKVQESVARNQLDIALSWVSLCVREKERGDTFGHVGPDTSENEVLEWIVKEEAALLCQSGSAPMGATVMRDRPRTADKRTNTPLLDYLPCYAG